MRPCGPHSSSPCWRHGLALVDCPALPEQVLLASHPPRACGGARLLTRRWLGADMDRCSSIHPLSARQFDVITCAFARQYEYFLRLSTSSRNARAGRNSGPSTLAQANGPPEEGASRGGFRYILRIREHRPCIEPRRFATTRSEHAGFELGRVGHHRMRPGWIEHQIHVRFDDGGDHLQLGSRVVHQNVAHAAARRGER